MNIQRLDASEDASCIARLLIAIGDAPASQVIRGNLDDNLIARKDANVVHSNLAGNGAKDDLAVFKLDVEHRVGKGFQYSALQLDSCLFAHPTYFLPANHSD